MARPNRRTRWREVVYSHHAPGMTNGVRVLCLLLADHMNAQGIVSVPRTQLAETLGIHERRVTERMTLARDLGLLDIVRRGRPGVTAVYQATLPPADMVRKPAHDMVRPGAPLETGHMVRPGSPPSRGLTNSTGDVRTAGTPNPNRHLRAVHLPDDLGLEATA